MITGHITKHAIDLEPPIDLEPRMTQVLRWLAELDDMVPAGTYSLCENSCEAVVVETHTAPADKKPYEAHRRYVDIHYNLRGGEIIEYAPLGQLVEIQAYTYEDDVLLLQGGCAPRHVVLWEGDICILFPEDGHKPCCASDTHSVKKVVVKVPVGWITPDVQVLE